MQKICSEKDCSSAGILRDISNFYFRKDRQKYYNICKNCQKKRRLKYYENNKDQILDQKKEYYENNKDKIKEIKKEYRENNKEKIREYKKEYYESNKIQILEHNREYIKQRRQIDLIFKLKDSVSKVIRQALKKQNSSKNDNSCLKYLSYTIEELKNHLESQFEDWMTWDNYGIYKINDWDDNDVSTWKWNIDHIIPQSNLLYSSMEDENFKKCWALDNLRPYSAKQNGLDGNRK